MLKQKFFLNKNLVLFFYYQFRIFIYFYCFVRLIFKSLKFRTQKKVFISNIHKKKEIFLSEIFYQKNRTSLVAWDFKKIYKIQDNIQKNFKKNKHKNSTVFFLNKTNKLKSQIDSPNKSNRFIKFKLPQNKIRLLKKKRNKNCIFFFFRFFSQFYKIPILFFLPGLFCEISIKRYFYEYKSLFISHYHNVCSHSCIKSLDHIRNACFFYGKLSPVDSIFGKYLNIELFLKKVFINVYFKNNLKIIKNTIYIVLNITRSFSTLQFKTKKPKILNMMQLHEILVRRDFFYKQFLPYGDIYCFFKRRKSLF